MKPNSIPAGKNHSSTDTTRNTTSLITMDEDTVKTGTEQTTSPGPLLVFVLGAPCSGKSTLCAALAKRYNLAHLSLGDELRSLVSDTPSNPVSRIKHLFSDAELDTFRNNLSAGTLGPVHLTPKYVKERVFPASCEPENVRMLIDGFPRDSERWVPFKEFAKPVWAPSRTSVLIVLDVDKEVAWERFTRRGRAGDVFERRFEEHTRLVPSILEAMRKDEMIIFSVRKEENANVEATVDRLTGLLG
ncbi:2-(3-amino-3-carboxypropyl)histidine synthase [Ascochyta rabiei]|uniref:ATP binding n=1 Tax=Didymella rabiei TaxID=5454 RepID=A0A162W4R1_DIDRA|nr:2-(3-amino-3-carboxypropyl)histidine synthase [Ascochyta rabiei]KZM18795.1 ATP binding [Ascochyta rabiei]UPX16164.1 2-(3-amino-3-carboxypropyl)histidine synthase [Ascochyta rabiei]